MEKNKFIAHRVLKLNAVECFQAGDSSFSNHYFIPVTSVIGIVGKIAEQAVAQILFNGSYKRLRVKVRFFNNLRSSPPPAFDSILENLLLNYTSSNNPHHRFTKSSCLAPAFPALKLSITRSNVYWLSLKPDGGSRIQMGAGAQNCK
jgi:hypothetical protein